MMQAVHYFDDFFQLVGNLGVETSETLFDLGKIIVTAGALDALEESGDAPDQFLARHQRGDWGDLGEGDRQENDFSVGERLRIFSAYHTSKGEKLWIITEADRRSTTILLPCEY
jgi:hypothetical protein